MRARSTTQITYRRIEVRFAGLSRPESERWYCSFIEMEWDGDVLMQRTPRSVHFPTSLEADAFAAALEAQQ